MLQARSSGSALGAPAPRPRSGVACLPARGLWPELTVATGSSRSSVAHTALAAAGPGYLCPWRHSRARIGRQSRAPAGHRPGTAGCAAGVGART